MVRGVQWYKEHRYLLLALATALLTGAYAYTYLGEVQQQVEVVVLAVDLPEASKIEGTMLKAVPMPGAAVHRDAVRRPEQALGRYLLRSGVAGEQLLLSQLSDDGRRQVVRGRLGRDERAMFIPVPLGKALGGAVRPNDRVDLIYVPNEQKVGLNTTRVLLQNLRVLDVRSERGRSLPEGEGNREASFAGILVAVSPAEGEKIAFALEHGSLYLALDGYEASPALTPGAAPQTIFAGPPAAPLPAGVSSSGSAGRN